MDLVTDPFDTVVAAANNEAIFAWLLAYTMYCLINI